MTCRKIARKAIDMASAPRALQTLYTWSSTLLAVK